MRYKKKEHEKPLTKEENLKISVINTIKNSVLALTLIFILFFQLQWFLAIDNIDIQYDFSKYNNQIYDKMEIDDYFNSMFSYISENTVNITEVSEEVLNNETLVDLIEDKVNQTITIVQQIYDSYLNGTLGDLIYNYFEELWRLAFNYFIPDEYLEPTFITISKDGWSSITGINAYLDLYLDDMNVRIISSQNSRISPEEPLVLEFTLANLLNSISEIAFDILVELTVDILVENGGWIYSDFFDFIKDIINNYNLKMEFKFEGLFGLFFMTFNLEVELNDFIKNII